jgi:hypothetical protein
MNDASDDEVPVLTEERVLAALASAKGANELLRLLRAEP